MVRVGKRKGRGIGSGSGSGRSDTDRTLDATNGSALCVSIEHGNGQGTGHWRHLGAGHSDSRPLFLQSHVIMLQRN